MMLISKPKIRSGGVFGSESKLDWSFLESASKQGKKANQGEAINYFDGGGGEQRGAGTRDENIS